MRENIVSGSICATLDELSALPCLGITLDDGVINLIFDSRFSFDPPLDMLPHQNYKQKTEELSPKKKTVKKAYINFAIKNIYLTT